MKKTLNFAAIHFTIAFTVAYVLTGDILLGSLVAMLEPSVNTLAFYFHEKVWSHFNQYRAIGHLTRNKTTSFAIVHFSVAFSIAYMISGDLFVGGIMAAIEPCFNTIAYYFHEKQWQRKHHAMLASAH